MVSSVGPLFSDEYAPVTSAVGFLRVPLETAAEALRSWRERLHGRASAKLLRGDLKANIRTLEPLTGGVAPRELVVGTANPEWTAFFDNSLPGSDPTPGIGHLSRTMKVQGLTTVYIPDVPANSGRPLRYGACQFEMFGAIKTDFLNYVRSISVVRDGTRWRFDANGVVQDFEDVEAYRRRRVVDRFTPAMLMDYSRELGVAPLDDAFYSGPCILVTNPAAPRPGAKVMSIKDVQRWRGITPGGV